MCSTSWRQYVPNTSLSERLLTRLPLPWHTLMFACVPTLFLFAHNRHFIPSSQLAWPLFVSIVGSLLLWVAGSLMLRSAVAAALLVTPLVFAVQTYGLLYEAVASVVQRGSTAHLITLSSVTLILAVTLALWAVAVVSWRRKTRLAAFTRALNRTGLFLVCLNLALAVEFSGPQPESPYSASSPTFGSRTLVGPRPDVYSLIVDQYASSSEMAAQYNGDAGELEQWLEARGFRIARQATSRFTATARSLDALLNMGPSRTDENLKDSSDVRWSRQIGLEFTTSERFCGGIRESKVMATFRSIGYRIVNIGSWFDCTRYNIHADENVNVYGWGLSEELSALAVQASIVRPLWAGDNEGLRKGILRQFDVFGEQRTGTGPTLVFAHVISPHAPYVFDREGNQPAHLDEKELYRGQHQFITSKIKEVVGRILSRPGPRPVILIQSDHGGKIHRDPQFGYRVFSAMHLPGDDDSEWRDDLRLEDTFKLVFKRLGLCQNNPAAKCRVR